MAALKAKRGTGKVGLDALDEGEEVFNLIAGRGVVHKGLVHRAADQLGPIQRQPQRLRHKINDLMR